LSHLDESGSAEHVARWHDAIPQRDEHELARYVLRSVAGATALDEWEANRVPAHDFLKLAIESWPGGVMVVGPAGTITIVNASLERTFGYTRGELIGQAVERLLPDFIDSRDIADRSDDSASPQVRPMGAGQTQDGSCKDGSRIPVEIGWSSLQTGAGRFVLVSVVNVSDHADPTCRASDQRFRTLADDAPVMIWVSGPDTLCTWFNRRWLEFVGHGLDHEIGNGWADGVHADDREACLRAYTAAFEARAPFSMEYRLRRHDGAWRWILDHGTPTFTPDGAFAGYLGSRLDVTEQKEAKLGLESALVEVQKLRDQLQMENVLLRREVEERLEQGAVVGQSGAVRHVLEQIEQVAATDSTVLLVGETGTGKELFASRLHERSARHLRTMVRVNCAAIPATLIESELFGREKGAFTGALARQIGRFEMADHSTIFLDEIGDLPSEVQVKLLRVLEERRVERLGSPKTIPVDARIIAATHRNLEQLMTDGTFREDLYYRLNVFPIAVPALRERIEDIPLLVWRFVDEFSKRFGKRIESIGKDNLAALQRYAWPGNIRELRNVVERAMITATGTRLTIPVPEVSSAASRRSVRLVDVERTHIRGVLESTGWRIRGVGGAADQLGLKPTTLETRLAKLGLKRPAPHA
jgi:PAS domain S-box-containing protein